MSLTTTEVHTLTQHATLALRRGDAAAARKAYDRLVDGGRADAQTLLGQAYACRALRDNTAAMAAVDRLLALDSRLFQAVLLKADLLMDAGDERAAALFYQAALKCAPAEAPPVLQAEIARAQRLCAQFAARFEQFLAERLGSDASPRFAQSLDILFGRKQAYTQQPRYYFFPELPNIQFFERAQFPWLAELESHTDAIRAELQAVMGEQSAFQPYVQGQPGLPMLNRGGMLDNADWSAFYLWKDGEVVAENAARCPRTMAALERVPLPRIPGRAPTVLFSQLRPGAHIEPHHGVHNARAIGHLPLIVPPGCAFRVGNELREWREGHAWVFDDTIEHEAWNRSGETRVILLFELWRPELSIAEQDKVSALFTSIDAYGGKTAWDM